MKFVCSSFNCCYYLKYAWTGESYHQDKNFYAKVYQCQVFILRFHLASVIMLNAISISWHSHFQCFLLSPFLVRKWLKNGEKQIEEVVKSGMTLPVCLCLEEKTSQPLYVAICGIWQSCLLLEVSWKYH